MPGALVAPAFEVVLFAPFTFQQPGALGEVGIVGETAVDHHDACGAVEQPCAFEQTPRSVYADILRRAGTYVRQVERISHIVGLDRCAFLYPRRCGHPVEGHRELTEPRLSSRHGQQGHCGIRTGAQRAR